MNIRSQPKLVPRSRDFTPKQDSLTMSCNLKAIEFVDVSLERKGTDVTAGTADLSISTSYEQMEVSSCLGSSMATSSATLIQSIVRRWLARTAAISSSSAGRSSRLRKKAKYRKKKIEKEKICLDLPVEKMKRLGAEYFKLSQEMENLPENSPEYVLLTKDVEIVSNELKVLYEESKKEQLYKLYQSRGIAVPRVKQMEVEAQKEYLLQQSKLEYKQAMKLRATKSDQPFTINQAEIHHNELPQDTSSFKERSFIRQSSTPALFRGESTSGYRPQDGNDNALVRSKSVDQIQNKEQPDEMGKCNVDEFVNLDRLLHPHPLQYAYSQANLRNRRKFERARSHSSLGSLTKSNSMNLTHSLTLEDSCQSGVSLISELSRKSSYRGPTPLKRDGSTLRSALKSSYDEVSHSRQSSPNLKLNKSGPSRRCSFSSVSFQEYERIAGDNPCVSHGVPLSIGWGHSQEVTVGLDDYESTKGSSRVKSEMIVPPKVRRQILRDYFDVTTNEINYSIRQVNITKSQRRNTRQGEPMELWTELYQSAKRKVSRFIKGTSTAKEEEKIWAQARKIAMED